jgi:hypothetical protein
MARRKDTEEQPPEEFGTEEKIGEAIGQPRTEVEGDLVEATETATAPEGSELPTNTPKFTLGRKSLFFVGPRDRDGQPAAFLHGIPARDLLEGSPGLARLTDLQIEQALASGLYSREKPAGEGNAE